MTTDFMGELQDGIVGEGIFELEYLFYGVSDDKNVVNVPAVQMGFRGGNVVEYGIFDVGRIKVCESLSSFFVFKIFLYPLSANYIPSIL